MLLGGIFLSPCLTFTSQTQQAQSHCFGSLKKYCLHHYNYIKKKPKLFINMWCPFCSREVGLLAESGTEHGFSRSGTLIISGQHKKPCSLPFICLCSCMNCGDSTAAECVVGFLASQQTLHASDLDREQTRFCCCEDPCSESTILVHCYKHTALVLQ